MDDFIRSEVLLPLRCTASRPIPGVCVAHLAGELDMATAPLLAHHLREQTATRPTELVLDLGDVTLLAAAGLAVIVTAHIDQNNGRLHLVGVTGNRPVERVLRLTGLISVLDVHDELQALLDALRESS